MSVNLDFYEADVFEVTKEETEQSYETSQELQERPLHQRITQFTHDSLTTHVIDNVLRVKTLSDYILAQNVIHWTKVSSERKWSALGYFALSALSAGIGFLLGSFPGALPVQFIAIPLAVIGGVITIYHLVGFAKACSQAKLWKQNHAVDVAHQRSDAFEKGFVHILNSDRANTSTPLPFTTILTKTEIQGLYTDYFYKTVQAFQTTRDEAEEISLLHCVAQRGPLSEKALTYAALSKEELSMLTRFRSRYETFASNYRNANKRVDEERKVVREAASKEIAEAKKEKKEALGSIEKNYLQLRKMIQETTESQIRNNGQMPDSPELVISDREIERKNEQIVKKGRAQLKKAEENYRKAREGTAKSFDDRIQKAQTERDEKLKALLQNGDSLILTFFDEVAELHQEAYDALTAPKPEEKVFPEIHPDIKWA